MQLFLKVAAGLDKYPMFVPSTMFGWTVDEFGLGVNQLAAQEKKFANLTSPLAWTVFFPTPINSFCESRFGI
jgi:hypothetical protein